jgi:predicted nucleotidyltransferase
MSANVLDKVELDAILYKFNIEMKNIFKETLLDMILFGSYAKGNPEYGSDIDIMLIVTIDKDIIKEYRDKVSEVVFSMGIEYLVLFSPIIQNYHEFEKYKDASGFFKNVLIEGVKISA